MLKFIVTLEIQTTTKATTQNVKLRHRFGLMNSETTDCPKM